MLHQISTMKEERSLRWLGFPHQKSSVQFFFDTSQALQYKMPKSNLPKLKLHNQTLKRPSECGDDDFGEKRWTFVVFKCKIMTSSGGLGKREAQRSEFKAS